MKKKVLTSAFTKVVGYIAPTTNFNEGRKQEADARRKVNLR